MDRRYGPGFYSTGKGDEITGIGVTTNGDVYAVGVTNGVFAYGFTTPTQDIFTLQLSPGGDDLAAVQIGTGPLVSGGTTVGPVIALYGASTVFIGDPTDGAYPGFANASKSVEMFIGKLLF